MRRHHGFASSLFALCLLPGCPGDRLDIYDDGGPYWQDQAVPPQPRLDSAVVPDTTAQPDTARPPDTGPPPDTLPADTLSPDTLPHGGPGDPCPCHPDLRCVEGVCRVRCVSGGLCNVVSNCPADQACIAACPDTDVCLPAVGAGQACNEKTYCANGHVCASDSGGAYRCVPVCAPVGSACGQSGTCMAGGANCSICTSP